MADFNMASLTNGNVNGFAAAVAAANAAAAAAAASMSTGQASMVNHSSNGNWQKVDMSREGTSSAFSLLDTANIATANAESCKTVKLEVLDDFFGSGWDDDELGGGGVGGSGGTATGGPLLAASPPLTSNLANTPSPQGLDVGVMPPLPFGTAGLPNLSMVAAGGNIRQAPNGGIQIGGSLSQGGGGGNGQALLMANGNRPVKVENFVKVEDLNFPQQQLAAESDSHHQQQQLHGPPTDVFASLSPLPAISLSTAPSPLSSIPIKTSASPRVTLSDTAAAQLRLSAAQAMIINNGSGTPSMGVGGSNNNGGLQVVIPPSPGGGMSGNPPDTTTSAAPATLKLEPPSSLSVTAVPASSPLSSVITVNTSAISAISAGLAASTDHSDHHSDSPSPPMAPLLSPSSPTSNKKTVFTAKGKGETMAQSTRLGSECEFLVAG